VTGFAGRDDPRHDVGLGEPVPGPAAAALGSVARRLGLWVAFGLFKRAGTAFGTVTTLICGDLFNEDVLRQCAAVRPDVLLVPIARGFDTDLADDDQWRSQEQAIYAHQMQKTGAVGLLVSSAARTRRSASAVHWLSRLTARCWRHGRYTLRDYCWLTCLRSHAPIRRDDRRDVARRPSGRRTA
jgi:hypothetical protein